MGRSRHVDALVATVARDFIRATGKAYGAAVAVTYRELITVRARAFRRPLLCRYRLREIASVELFRGRSVNRLMLAFKGREPARLQLLFGPSAASDAQGLLAAIERLALTGRHSEQARLRAVAGAAGLPRSGARSRIAGRARDALRVGHTS